LGWSWNILDPYNETRGWLDKIRALPDITNYPALYGKALNRFGIHSLFVADYNEARNVLEEARAIWLKLGVEGERGLAESLSWLGLVTNYKELDYHKAQSLIQQSFELYQKCGGQWERAQSLSHLGTVERLNNDVTSISLLEESLIQLRQLGDLFNIFWVSHNLGGLFLKQRDFDKARLFFEQGLMIGKKLEFTLGIGNVLWDLGELYRQQGDFDQAEQFYREGLSLSREHGIKNDIANGLFYSGLVALHRNNYSLASRHFIDSFDSATTVDKTITACDLLTGLAAVAGGTNQPERAAKLSGTAQTILESTDYSYVPFDRAEFGRHIKIAREQLGEAKFEALAAEGRAMTIEQAIAFALEKSDE